MTRLASIPLVLIICAPGCSLKLDRKPAPPKEQQGVFVEPTGDGSHYIEVVGEPRVPAKVVQGKWKRTATRVCEGDYLVMSENAFERKRGPFVEGRVYEGWVRCVSPDVSGDETKDDEKAEAKAQAKPVRPRLLPRLSG